MYTGPIEIHSYKPDIETSKKSHWLLKKKISPIKDSKVLESMQVSVEWMREAWEMKERKEK